MKLQPIIYATLFAAITGLSFGALAATDTEGKPAATDAKPAATEMKPATPAHKKMKPHSHMQEKTGVAPTTPEAKPDENANKPEDKSQHNHPRDAK
jgi:hypothetical protein